MINFDVVKVFDILNFEFGKWKLELKDYGGKY